MREPSDRTKVVIRHLPPAISRPALMDLVDAKFAGRYDWFSFRPGNHSQKHQRYSRAYISFKMAGDVVEFAEIFNGHTFVNEKGTQFKAVVEYAPSQRVPKQWLKKDGREGTILKDPDYLEFLELISKPVEHLPSAEIQLERKEAERAGAAKEVVIVTPLMEFVRQKRATKNDSQKLTSGKHRTGLSSSSSTRSSRKGFDRRRGVSTPVYVLRDGTKNGSAVEKTPYILMSKREEQNTLADKTASGGKEPIEEEFASGAVGLGKSRIVLLKGKEKEISDVHGGLGLKHVPSDKRPSGAKQNPNGDATGRIVTSILTKEGRSAHLSISESQPEQQLQVANVEKDKRPPRPPTRSTVWDNVSGRSSFAVVSDGGDKRHLDEKVSLNNSHVSVTIIEKHDRRSKNKDRPDRGVWAPLRRSEKSSYGDGSLSSLEHAPMLSDSLENTPISSQIAGRREDIQSQVGGRISLSSVENGSHRLASRRGAPRNSKDADGSSNISEFKTSKRGSGGYGSHERQVWVQKSGPAA